MLCKWIVTIPSLVIIELNAYCDVKIDPDVILCKVQTSGLHIAVKSIRKLLTYPRAYCDTWSLCCNHGDVRNPCVGGIHCCTEFYSLLIVVITVLYITQCIDHVFCFCVFLHVKRSYLFKESCFIFLIYACKRLNKLFDQHLICYIVFLASA